MEPTINPPTATEWVLLESFVWGKLSWSMIMEIVGDERAKQLSQYCYSMR